jgi:hypothetical protein
LRTQGTDRRLADKAGIRPDAKIEARMEARVRATTEELLAVMSDHAPMWFTETRYNRIVDALRAGTEKLPAAFCELFELLEQYAPGWYGKALHDKAAVLFRELHAAKKSAPGPRSKRTG